MKLSKAVRDVEKWNLAFGHVSDDDDEREHRWRTDLEMRELAWTLIHEELSELDQAMFFRDRTPDDLKHGDDEPALFDELVALKDGEELPLHNDIEVLDAICDILVTTFGVAAKAGLTDLVEPAFKEVMRSNWSKLDADGKPVFYPNGKIAKSELYEPPALEQFFGEEYHHG